MLDIRVQEADFDFAKEYHKVSQDPGIGAVVSFVGKVRDMNLGDDVLGLRLEHYPGMTEKALHDIAEQAASRWSLQTITIIHRVGDLDLGDQIVLVMTCSPHRDEGYEANRFIMDFLKSKAPFWKKERIKQGERWIEQRESDVQAVKKW